jgi:hypothetical protein
LSWLPSCSIRVWMFEFHCVYLSTSSRRYSAYLRTNHSSVMIHGYNNKIHYLRLFASLLVCSDCWYKSCTAHLLLHSLVKYTEEKWEELTQRALAVGKCKGTPRDGKWKKKIDFSFVYTEFRLYPCNFLKNHSR